MRPIRPAAALHGLPAMLLTMANALVRTFLAPACAGCEAVLDRPLSGAVCEACWRAVVRLTPPLCDVCGDALPPAGAGAVCGRCSIAPPYFSIARSAARYDGRLRQVIHAFKYGRRRPLAVPLAALMMETGAGVLAGADAVVPVPLHPWRALERGFNQADDLAAHLGLPVWRILRRRRHGSPQAALTASARGPNVRHAFAFGPAFGMLNRYYEPLIRDRIVVLVDDVMTTGATLNACSAVLLAAGVRNVRALTAARAVATRPPPPPDRLRHVTARR